MKRLTKFSIYIEYDGHCENCIPSNRVNGRRHGELCKECLAELKQVLAKFKGAKVEHRLGPSIVPPQTCHNIGT